MNAHYSNDGMPDSANKTTEAAVYRAKHEPRVVLRQKSCMLYQLTES